MNKRGIASIIIFVVALFCAAESYGLVMGPAKFETRLPPNEIAEGDYYVQNDTDKDAHVVVEPENWFKEAYDYGKLDIKDWVTFNTYEFDLKPKEIKKLRIKITVPINVKGELVAQIFFTSAVPREKGQPSPGTIHARLGAVLYVAIKGTERVDAEITSMAVSTIAEDGKNILKVDATLMNNGNVHLRPIGSLIITDEKGTKVAGGDMVTGSPVLPHQDYIFSASLDKPELKAGKYKVSVTMEYGKLYEMKKDASLEKEMQVDASGGVVLK